METINGVDVIKHLYGRALLYDLTHKIFSGEPSSELFNAIGISEVNYALTDMSSYLLSLKNFLDYIKNYKIATEENKKYIINQNLSFYNKIILGLGSKSVAHPWESSYTNNKKLLFQSETLDVRYAYKEFGYLPAKYPRVPDDHIALECAFMASMSNRLINHFSLSKNFNKEDKEIIKIIDGQIRFLENHLSMWVSQFSKDLNQESDENIYAITSNVLENLVDVDYEILQALIK